MEDVTPPAALLYVLARKWESGVVEDKSFAAGRSSHVAVNLDVGALVETGSALFRILRSLAGRCLEGLNRITLLKIDGNRVVPVLHLMFCIADSEYKNRPGDLWAAKGDIPQEGLPTLVKL